MPDLDGFDVITALHDDPTTHGTPIVVLTAHTLTAAREGSVGRQGDRRRQQGRRRRRATAPRAHHRRVDRAEQGIGARVAAGSAAALGQRQVTVLQVGFDGCASGLGCAGATTRYRMPPSCGSADTTVPSAGAGPAVTTDHTRPLARRVSSSTVPRKMSRPLASTATSRQVWAMSSTMCVLSSTVRGRRAGTAGCGSGSAPRGRGPAVGSSTISSRGSASSACAMPTRARIPPEKPRSRRSASAVSATTSSSSPTRRRRTARSSMPLSSAT